MKKQVLLFAAMIAGGGLYAQSGNVGIGTNTPAAKLDVIGKIKITDGTQGANKILTSDANGLASWKPNPFSATAPTLGSPYVKATGGTDIAWNNNAGWVNNTLTDIILNEASDPNNVYNPATGIVTVDSEGVYFVTVGAGLTNNLGTPASPFDGNGGIFYSYLYIKPNGSGTFNRVAGQTVNILRGVSFPSAIVQYEGSVETMLHLQAGDQIKLVFATYNTASMNSAPANLILSKGLSYITMFKF